MSTFILRSWSLVNVNINASTPPSTSVPWSTRSSSKPLTCWSKKNCWSKHLRFYWSKTEFQKQTKNKLVKKAFDQQCNWSKHFLKVCWSKQILISIEVLWSTWSSTMMLTPMRLQTKPVPRFSLSIWIRFELRGPRGASQCELNLNDSFRHHFQLVFVFVSVSFSSHFVFVFASFLFVCCIRFFLVFGFISFWCGWERKCRGRAVRTG